MDYQIIKTCRVCNSENITSVLSLGNQFYTGIFPKSKIDYVPIGPLELCLCSVCSTVQLLHKFNSTDLYGDNYGYRSGLNKSMVQHLKQKANFLSNYINLVSEDWVLDIGSNDGTLLSCYLTERLNKVGIDPSATKFKKYYKKDIFLVEDFFSANNYFKVTSSKARLITSIAMFYDLDAPVDFAKQIFQILTDDGIWHFEQSYLPSMINTNSFDTICHEHSEYYSLHSILYILKSAKLRILDISFNSINGGSFAITACKENANHISNNVLIDFIYNQEKEFKYNTNFPFIDFSIKMKQRMDSLVILLQNLKNSGKTVLGYGASTKGNVTLQYAGIDESLIKAIVEVNPDKFNHFTPGTHIPIISEAEAKLLKPDYYLVLPWHFKNEILIREQDFINSGGRFIFPLPELEII
jgi:hypothetical protein